MGAVVSERDLRGLRWLVVSGRRGEVFRALGAAAAQEVRTVIGGLPETGGLRDFAESPGGRPVIDEVLSASRSAYPEEMQELLDIAAGAGVDPDALLLANLRGDLGGDDATGCSDLAFQGRHSIMAHNEDGAPALEGHLMVVTLKVDGEVPVTVQWYPGFAPCNTFVVTGHGLVWGIDHIQVGSPSRVAGRHFVARRLQQQRTVDEAVRYLETHPSAGGFAYTLGEVTSGRIVTVESAAGAHAVVAADPVRRPALWHTNHLRYLGSTSLATPAPTGCCGVRSLGHRQESLTRGKVLAAWQPRTDSPAATELLELLANRAAPDGVFRSAAGGDPLMTLCTTATDLTDRTITLQPRGKAPVTLDIAEYASGVQSE
jgi:hypothetical protein